MKKYIHLFKIAFEEFFEYRLNFFWRITSQILSTFVLIAFWICLLKNTDAFADFKEQDIINYYIFMGTLTSINQFNIWSFSNSILKGDIVNTITKPISHFFSWFIEFLPDKILSIIIYIISGIILMSFRVTIFPERKLLISFLISLVLGILGSFLISYSIGILTFWLKRVHGVQTFVRVLGSIFAGTYIPLSLLPLAFRQISKFLPLRYFSYLPIEILQNHLNSSEIRKNLIIELAWILLLILVYKFLWRKGIKNLEAVGI